LFRGAYTNNKFLIQIRSEECINLFEQVKAENSDRKGRLKKMNKTDEETKGKRSLEHSAKKG